MSGPSGYALTTEFETEIVSAYAASMQEVPGVAAAPGWFVVGSFYLPKTLDKVRLEVIALVSAVGLTGTARLYDPTLGVDAPVVGSEAIFTGQDLARFFSGIVALTGNRTYWMQAQVVGAAGVDKWGTVATANLLGP